MGLAHLSKGRQGCLAVVHGGFGSLALYDEWYLTRRHAFARFRGHNYGDIGHDVCLDVAAVFRTTHHAKTLLGRIKRGSRFVFVFEVV